MPVFSWVTFFDRHRIDYQSQGANVGGDNVAIRCPFCGPRDQSHHMSVSIVGNGWHCWRDREHAGVAPTRLIQALLRIDWSAAQAIAGTARSAQPAAGRTLVETVAGMLEPLQLPPPPDLELPETFRPLSLTLPVARPYRDYVSRRGFDPDQLDAYDVHFDHRGKRFHGRIVFVIKAAGGRRTVGFSGRAIAARMEPRYLFEGATDVTLPWSYMFPKRGRLLVLTEGPFDALKVNLLGNRQGIYATCCMTSDFSRTQRSLLYELLPRFEAAVALFDQGNEAAGFRLANLFPGRIIPRRLPATVYDPAELYNLDFLIN